MKFGADQSLVGHAGLVRAKLALTNRIGARRGREARVGDLSAQLTALVDGGAAPTRPLIRSPGWRTNVHALLNRPSSSPKARLVRAVTLGIILLSTMCFVLQSIASLSAWGGWPVIDALVAIAREAGREPATPAETREFLGI